MAYLDEIDVGDNCLVTDADDTKLKGLVIATLPGGSKKSPDPVQDRVLVRLDESGVVVRVAPSFVTLAVGE